MEKLKTIDNSGKNFNFQSIFDLKSIEIDRILGLIQEFSIEIRFQLENNWKSNEIQQNRPIFAPF